MSSSGGLISEYAFVRTGLLGFIGPGGLVFITGKMDGLIMVSGRRHNADDIVATALAVEPMKFVYRGRWVWLVDVVISQPDTLSVTLMNEAG